MNHAVERHITYLTWQLPERECKYEHIAHKCTVSIESKKHKKPWFSLLPESLDLFPKCESIVIEKSCYWRNWSVNLARWRPHWKFSGKIAHRTSLWQGIYRRLWSMIRCRQVAPWRESLKQLTIGEPSRSSQYTVDNSRVWVRREGQNTKKLWCRSSGPLNTCLLCHFWLITALGTYAT